MVLREVAGHEDGQDVVGRVASGGERASPDTRLVDGTHIGRADFNVCLDCGFDPDGWADVEQHLEEKEKKKKKQIFIFKHLICFPFSALFCFVLFFPPLSPLAANPPERRAPYPSEHHR